MDHHKDFEKGFGEMVEDVALRSKVDDVEGESEGREEDEESESRCDQSLDHRVKHQREVSPWTGFSLWKYGVLKMKQKICLIKFQPSNGSRPMRKRSRSQAERRPNEESAFFVQNICTFNQ